MKPGTHLPTRDSHDQDSHSVYGNFLAVTAAGGAVVAAATARAASFGNPDEPPQGAINTQESAASLSDPGPNNPVLSRQSARLGTASCLTGDFGGDTAKIVLDGHSHGGRFGRLFEARAAGS